MTTTTTPTRFSELNETEKTRALATMNDARTKAIATIARMQGKNESPARIATVVRSSVSLAAADVAGNNSALRADLTQMVMNNLKRIGKI